MKIELFQENNLLLQNVFVNFDDNKTSQHKFILVLKTIAYTLYSLWRKSWQSSTSQGYLLVFQVHLMYPFSIEN